ncbi:MAG: CRTAC1 family protein [Gemmataceae bacterium]
MLSTRGTCTFLLLLAACGCRNDAPPPAADPPPEKADGPAWFEDITDRAGLNFVHDPGDVAKYLMYQCVGSGCAIVDLDGDGRPDLLLLSNAGPGANSTNRLYHQKADRTFEDVSAGSGLDFAGHNMGVAVGDLDNDGRPDLILTQVNGAKVLLNRGGMRFEDVTKQSGLQNPMWGTSVAIFDFDRDGRLDVFVANYVDYDPSWPCISATGAKDYCAPKVFHGTASKLFRNRGTNPVTFEDATVSSRIGERAGPGLGVAVFDCDGDGWPDVFVANDGKPNHLWFNKRDGTFAEEAASRGAAMTALAQAFAGMGVALGDLDNDGLFDLYVTHLASETNTLWRQHPAGQFQEATAAWSLTATHWRGTGFGTLAADFNNDGWLDLAIANGRVAREPVPKKKPILAPHWEPYGERNQIFANTSQRSFRDISLNTPAFCGYDTVARGLACGDVDGDGLLDLLVNAVGEKARLLKGVAPERGNWIAVRAIDPRLKRDAIGARIIVRCGETIRTRLIASSDSYLSAGPLVSHFGLGSSDRVDSFEVQWPDGSRESFQGVPAGQTIELLKGRGRTP